MAKKKTMKQIIVEIPKANMVWKSVEMDQVEFDSVMKPYTETGKLHIPIISGQVSFGKQLLEEAVVSIINK